MIETLFRRHTKLPCEHFVGLDAQAAAWLQLLKLAS